MATLADHNLATNLVLIFPTYSFASVGDTVTSVGDTAYTPSIGSHHWSPLAVSISRNATFGIQQCFFLQFWRKKKAKVWFGVSRVHVLPLFNIGYDGLHSPFMEMSPAPPVSPM